MFFATDFFLKIQAAILRYVCGITVNISGTENLPQEPYLIASQHESSWETLYFHALLGHPTMFAKREVFSYPLVGFLARRVGHIPVDRSGSVDAMRTSFARGKLAAQAGRNLLIFPTGTRGPAQKAKLHSGVAVLYQLVDLPVVPVLVSSGHCWPPMSIWKYPGEIRVTILPSIPAGSHRRDFLDRLSKDLTTQI